GSTQTDTLALERQRGITIKSAVVSFEIDDVTVNLIDTPGHPDFIAEVERVLSVLDGAVLVVSAVEGVQAQTRVLMRTLQRLRIPTLLFVNKIDRGGAQDDEVLKSIAARLTPAVVAMGSTHDLGTRAAGVTPYGPGDADFAAGLADLLADRDDALLAAYVADEAAVTYDRLHRALARQTRQAQVHPVYFGSAVTGAGVEALTRGVKELLPASDGAADGPVSGTVFKVERGAAGEKIAYVRMFSGTVRVRDKVKLWRPADEESAGVADADADAAAGETPATNDASGGDTTRGVDTSARTRDKDSRVTGISVFANGAAVPSGSVAAGQIGKLLGLGNVQIGDTVGTPVGAAEHDRHHFFAPPTLETVIVPSRASRKGALHVALAQLAEQDPLINLRQDDIRQEIYVSLYGEVQKEVIQATLASDYGLDVTFEETTTICVERPVGTGAAVESMSDDANPFNATVGLRVEPASLGTGVHFKLGIELGSLPFSFLRAVEETVRQTLQQGIYGWQVIDCTVTITHSGYVPPPPYGWSKWSSSAGDFRNLTPLVLMSALEEAGTRVYEPVQRFDLEIPADTLGAIVPALTQVRGVLQSQQVHGSSYLLSGVIPAARVHELQQQLPALTRGEGLLDTTFERYDVVRGMPPSRPRTDLNPLNRKEYLLRRARRL
ncbi:MAG TPA: translation factor GTPase family protein, partial [Actinopolymorphaceae bacterium]|nr:translation factor GTPase family protein [Actinopolymorphaceae bacterium]